MYNSPDTNMTIAIVVAATIGIVGSFTALLIHTFSRKPEWDTLQQMGAWLSEQYINEYKPLSVNERNHICKVIITAYRLGGVDLLRSTVVSQLNAEQYNVSIVGFVRNVLTWEVNNNKKQFETNLSNLIH